jgi:hypothetical protein
LLRDTTQKAAALIALDSILQPRYPGMHHAGAPVLTRQARWDLAELYDWKEYLVSNFSRARGTTINGWGVSNQKNAIELGIEKRETLLATMSWLNELHVPCRLVDVMVMGRFSIGAGQDMVRKPPIF